MDAIRQYILSVICIAILCGLTQTLFSKSSTGTLVKLITGLMITITVIGPLLRETDFSLGLYLDEISADGQWAVAKGEEAAIQTMSERIKEKTETYILDKAAQMGAAITVDVNLEESMPPAPAEITIKGTVSPYVKKQLTDCLRNDLGIPEDKQIWIS